MLIQEIRYIYYLIIAFVCDFNDAVLFLTLL